MYKIKGLDKYRRPITALNDGQFKAIHDSLAKWQFLSWHPDGTYRNEPDCKCCEYSGKGCGDKLCPIENLTGKKQCDGTPYYSWSHNCDYDETIYPEAEDEYHFLEGIYSIELHRRLGYGKV